MAYLIDHERAVRDRQIVAILRVQRRDMNSQLLLADGSVMSTRTRAVTFRHLFARLTSTHTTEGLVWVNDRSQARR